MNQCPARVFPAVICVFVVSVLVGSILVDGHGRRVMLVPIAIGIFIIVLSSLAFARDRRKTAIEAPPTDWLELISLLSVLPLVYLLGISIGAGVFVALYTRFHGVRMRLALPAGAGLAFVIHVVFERLLDASLYPGLLPGAG